MVQYLSFRKLVRYYFLFEETEDPPRVTVDCDCKYGKRQSLTLIGFINSIQDFIK